MGRGSPRNRTPETHRPDRPVASVVKLSPDGKPYTIGHGTAA